MRRIIGNHITRKVISTCSIGIIVAFSIFSIVGSREKEVLLPVVNRDNLNNVQTVTSEGDPNIRLYAQSAVLMDADSGRVLYQKNGEEPLAMASTTKIMTLLVTLENANLEDEVTVSSYAASMPDVQLHIREGETYRLKDLLYSLMLESHNDSAVAIAEHVGGSVEEFAVMMNRKAEEIGCSNTWFITPNGLDATANYKDTEGNTVTREHKTTAKDLALILSYCITKSPCKEQFLEITRTASYSFQDLSGKRSFQCNNHNAFLNMMSGALTGKTGFTGKAGYCYVGALKQDERTFVVALLACGWPNHKTYKWSDTRTLMEYGLANFHYRDFSDTEIPEEAVKPILVKEAKTDKIGQQVYLDVALEESKQEALTGVLMKEQEKIKITFQRAKELTAPVKEGETVGTLYFLIGEERWKTYKLVTKQPAEKIDFSWCLQKVMEYWLM